MQESFLRLFKEVEAGRTPDNVRAWLYRVGSNLAISRGRRRADRRLDWMSRYGRIGRCTVESPESDVLGRERTAGAGCGARRPPRGRPDGSPALRARASAARRSPRRSGEATAPRGRCCAAPGFASDSSSSAGGTSDDVEPRRDPRAGSGRDRLRAEPDRALDARPTTCATAWHARGTSPGMRPTSARSPTCRATRCARHGSIASPGASGAARRRRRSPLRLVAVAALLALLALGALAVGAELLRRQEDPNLSVVPPGPTASPPTTITDAGPFADHDGHRRRRPARRHGPGPSRRTRSSRSSSTGCGCGPRRPSTTRPPRSSSHCSATGRSCMSSTAP